MVVIAQLVEPWIVIPVVVGSNPINHPNQNYRICERRWRNTVDALASGASILMDVRVQIPFFALIIV